MEKRVEFRCSQERLFETVMNLANQGKWPPNWSYQDLGLRNPLGFIELQVCRERLLKHRVTPALGGKKLDLHFYRRVGKITFAGLGEHTSALIVRSQKPGLLRFFDDLTMILSEYLLPQSPGTAKPAMPPRGSSLETLFDHYHDMKLKGHKITFRDLAKQSGYAEGTFKQGHARYKLERGIS